MSKTVRRIITTIVVVAAIVMLTIVMVARTSNRTRENSISHMKSLTEEQSVMILDYVKKTEDTLSAFSTSDIIKEYLLDQTNEAKAAKAQAYTERFSATIDGVEGLWTGSWNTEVLTHTNPGVLGMVTRKEEGPLNQLRTALLEAGKDGVYDTGIIISPATGKQIVSMYKAIYSDSGDPIGFVGLGIFTDSLAAQLNNLELNTAGSTFSMVNVADTKYIFCNDAEMVGVETEDKDLLDLCEKYAGTSENSSGYFESDKNISFYSYNADKGWLLAIESPSKEVFDFSRSININMIAFCTVCIILIIIFNIISIKQEETVQKLEQSKKKQAAITKNLHTAALKDILTDVNNRIKFIDDFSKDDNGNYKIEDCPNNPYCFVMVNLSKFSQVNIMYGHDAGDVALATTADILKEHFGSQNVYRTGSDEFVVAVQSPSNNPASVIMEVNGVLADLRKPRKIGNNTLSVAYSAAIVKKSTQITPSVLITLKDMINNTSSTTDNNAAFVDMDTV